MLIHLQQPGTEKRDKNHHKQMTVRLNKIVKSDASIVSLIYELH